jgi:AcrR family transcriptional regulator
VDWAALRSGAERASAADGLREEKKRRLRQRLSDTATEMFLERGFDAVRVAEVARACGVSEKTVYNYFPTKESLLLDRWETTHESLRIGFSDRSVAPLGAVLRVLADELAGLTSWLAAQRDLRAAGAMMRRFGELVQSAPALRAYQHDARDRLTALVADLLAQRTGLSPDSPEAQIAATALLGLWSVQARSLRSHLDGRRTPAQIARAVTADVRRAARVVETGLQRLRARATETD